MNKESLFGKTLDELKLLVREAGLPAYSAGQIAGWLYQKDISSIDEMTNLSKESRKILNQKYQLGLTEFKDVKVSNDGTKKYLSQQDRANLLRQHIFLKKTGIHCVCLPR
jgi:23S rRNA (adenine2503-C2)-methyltransferase